MFRLSAHGNLDHSLLKIFLHLYGWRQLLILISILIDFSAQSNQTHKVCGCASLFLLLGRLSLCFASGRCVRFRLRCELSEHLAQLRFFLRFLFILRGHITCTELDLILSLRQIDLQLGRSLLVLLDEVVLPPQGHSQLVTLHIKLRPHHLRVY
jgi:hypothetical protein